MKKLVTALSLCAATFAAQANNIHVSGVATGTQNAVANTTQILFNTDWENSWRTSTNESNYDGAWIFVKYRKTSTNDWRHATLKTTGATPATGAAITISADGKGAFIYRSADGQGPVAYNSNMIVWDYGADGVADNDSVELRVFGLEMVYVPAGAYYLGSNGSETSHFRSGTADTAYRVNSAAAINVGTTANFLHVNGTGDNSGTIPATYPNGYNAYWAMKYEVTQQYYADFLNHLDYIRATNRVVGTLTGAHPNFIAPAPERAIGGMSAMDALALADWSGLRLLSELEFEKLARGSGIMPVPNEYAWGNTTIAAGSGYINPSDSTETATSGNAVFNQGNPRRVGLFATSSSNREQAGAAYYGALDLSGNVDEVVFTPAFTGGRSITATTHGDGYLGNTGNSDVAQWIATGNNCGLRGGGHTTNALQYLRASDRASVDYFTTYGLGSAVGTAGTRLARTAP